MDENSPDYVYKEFKRLVKQWKYEVEFNELVSKYPEFNYQIKRRRKSQLAKNELEEKNIQKNLLYLMCH